MSNASAMSGEPLELAVGSPGARPRLRRRRSKSDGVFDSSSSVVVETSPRVPNRPSKKDPHKRASYHPASVRTCIPVPNTLASVVSLSAQLEQQQQQQSSSARRTSRNVERLSGMFLPVTTSTTTTTSAAASLLASAAGGATNSSNSSSSPPPPSSASPPPSAGGTSKKLATKPSGE